MREHMDLPGGVPVERTITIDRPVQEMYQFWRRLDNLPKIMQHLESVDVLDEKRSRWKAQGPMKSSFEWHAEIISDVPDQHIEWKSVEDSEIKTAGGVYFSPAPGGRGTQIKVALSYVPPGGTAGANLAWLMGQEPSQQIAEDLRKFKQLMEAGEVATIEGQPSGASRPEKKEA